MARDPDEYPETLEEAFERAVREQDGTPDEMFFHPNRLVKPMPRKDDDWSMADCGY